MSHPSPSSPYDISGYGQQHPSQAGGRKRSRPHEELQPDLRGPLDQPPDPYGQAPGDVLVELTPGGRHPQSQGYSLHPYQQQPAPPPPPPQHHHHRLPDQRPTKIPRMAGEDTSPLQHIHGPPSVVGQEGMPPPAARPRGPKLKFTPEDDQLLVDLKEKKNLTWKQIADFFPGRSSGTLQVRYCTKLKAKTTVWTDEMVQKLRNAMQEYENDRWRIISSKVGSGFSPAACRDKAAELDVVEVEEEDQGGYTQSQMAPSSSDPTASFQ
ncbi:uncharacterized protein BDR25DRAFT_50675 [Lindgomyces ingoldianus]|uniref:Uncharacterized protein n=1 Tax=Lindgomyces ingoldianus TaxID=673940 RepID=A0ACB6QPW3_9PLEO|nr:uncharacterized protein BDR25DRAFT_50675 [Lindgomyces ingoldianus]KAF2469033.1 hypothetical protein BDR25DRAFT_50675 [Lindgomyces ingoldianus]